VHVAVDSRWAVDALADSARSAGVEIGILVDMDVGYGRTGVSTPQEALALAQAIDRANGARLDGIMTYPGHVWDAADQQEPRLAKISEKIRRTIELWTQAGLAATIVSGGSTPTMLQSHHLPELTEIRPGTYIFNDMNTVRGGFCGLEDCAARIIVTVISTAVKGQVVVDAGNKTLTSDQCVPAPQSGHGLVVELPEAKITRLSEEHGQIDISGCARIPHVGDRLSIVPNHICPCVNLQDQAWWIEPGEPPQPLVVDARGKLS
jgi:D-serine deaminase-like pyridoxal phosphate-dependent protein